MKAPLSKNKHPENLIKSKNLFPVIGVGASAGGLDAFKKLLKAIPVNSGMAYVLVQHLDPNHESMLTEILQKMTPIPVLEIADDIKVEPNHIYVIPSNKIMVATDGVLLLAPRPEKSKTERYLPIDLFFTSLAIVHQAHAIGVILSGTGTDGTLGLKAIKDYGGITFVQDEQSAAYPNMPNSAVQAEVVDFILPPDKMPEKLLEVTKIITTPTSVEENLPLGDEEAFRQINAVLRIRKGTDFTYYKQTTIRRRILRRMAINKNEEPAEYLNYLRENKPEQDLLYQDLLIPVTSFFRDSKVFDNLCANVFPIIKKDTEPGEPIRIWIAGCSTGEEAYSMAICLKEFLGSNSFDSEERVQIFATDLSERAILKARTGIYTKLDVVGLAPERLNNFFTKTNGSYQVNRQIRDLCVFATHNFLKDPPFGKMDLVSCRNVLIYMEPYLQKKALTTFHYALNPKGFLLLGKSETTSGVPDLFAATEKNDKLYTRKDVPSRFIHTVSPRTESNLIDNKDKPKTENMRSDFQKTADDIMLSKYSPAGVVINEAMDIVQFRGSTGRFLEQSSGKPSHNLLVLAKNGLAFELRNIIHKTKKGTIPVVKENIPVEINGSLTNITIEAIPLPNTIEPHYLILFHDSNSISNKQESTENKKPTRKTKTDDIDLRIKQLELELTQAREDMRSITEDQEAANEELQSANEELLSGSEELQSLNEELETSKEELQSTNEELMVVNHEMISLNEQIAAARNYAESIVANIREPLLVLDKNLRVKTANNSFYKTFLLNEKETEGVLIYDLGNKQWDNHDLRTLLEKNLPEKSIFYDFELTHSFPVIGERIMLLNASEVINKSNSEKLILLSIEDITEKALARKKIEDSEKRYIKMLMESPFAFAILKGQDMVVTLANDSIKQVWGKGNNIEGKKIIEVLPEIIDQEFPDLLLEVYKTGIPYLANESLAIVKRNDKMENVYFNFVYQPYYETDDTISGVTIIAIEVTEHVKSKKIIEENEKRYNRILMQSPFAFSMMEGKDMVITHTNALMKEFWGKGNDVEGKTILEVLPEIIDQPFPKMLDSVFTTGNHITENEVLTKLNRHGILEEHYFNLSFQPSFETDGTISGVIAIAHEVTEQVVVRKKIEESELKYRTLFNSIDAGFCIIEVLFDEDEIPYNYRFLEANNEFTKQTGLTDAIGKTIKELVDGHEQYWTDNYGRIAKTRISERFENEAKGLGSYFEVYAFPVGEPGENRVGVLFKNITQRKHSEEKLIEAKEFAENSVKSKQQFLSNMSHEIRTPLNSIIGFTNVLMRTEISEKQKEFLQAIKTSGKSLNLLINDILDLAKVDAGRMIFEKQPFEIQKSIKQILHSFDMKIKEKNLELENEYDNKIPSVLLGDSVRLNQILLNLLSNAVKFTHEGKIKLNINLLHEDHENVSIEFAVSDSGIGIASNKLNYIFNVFEQAEITISTFYGGTGLGLAIVKQLVEGQGGNISVKSTLGEGSTFSFVLPFGKTKLKLEEEIVAVEPDSEIKTLRVLVAEDVDLNQLLIKIILNDFGFEYEIVSNGKQAIEKMQTNTYDIILMDLQMPEMNGFEATAYIRDILKSQIPIIALTADVTTVNASKCQEFGMDDYISKPIKENLLYSKIVELVKKNS